VGGMSAPRHLSHALGRALHEVKFVGRAQRGRLCLGMWRAMPERWARLWWKRRSRILELVYLLLEKRGPSGGWRLRNRRRRGSGARDAMLELFVGNASPMRQV